MDPSDANTDPAAAETEIETPPAADPAQPDPAADPAADPKAKARDGYEARKAKQESEGLRKELEGYKRREEEARKATLTEQQRVQEERDTLAAENTRLKQERLQQKIAAEFKLPASLSARLIGSDEESLRADAEELSKLLPKPRAGSPTDPVRDQQGAPTYTRSQLRKDPKLARDVALLYQQGKCRIVEG